MKPIKLSDVGSQINKIDLLITSASFEDRCLSLVASLSPESYDKLWVCYNKNEEEFFTDNLDRLKKYPKNKLVEFSIDDPIITASSLMSEFQIIETIIENTVVDITTFTHEGLLILFKFISLNRTKLSNVYLSYTGAIEYSTNEKEEEEKWLTKGIKTIRSVLGYPGVLNPSKKNHLVILFGFESERTQKLIENFEFNKVSLGFGPENDSIQICHYNINRKRHMDLLSQYPFAEKFEFSLTDPFKAKDQVLEQISKFSDYNVVIAPLNNKLSTIGAGMAAIENPELQICYVRAHEYNLKGYSSSSDECYFIKL